jgi:beta-lactamase regulating signal transducer with metallopeptidase domain
MAWWIFQNLAITTVLAAAVAVVSRVWRIGPVARHALWVLVLVKFVTPPVLVWPWAAPDPLRLARVEQRVVPNQSPYEAFGALHKPAGLGDSSMSGSEASTAAPVLTASLNDIANPIAPSLWQWLFAVWVAGSLAVLAIEGARLVRLSGRIRQRDPDPAIVARVGRLSAQLEIRPVPVVMVSGLTSPVVWAWGRPRLLWPIDLGAGATEACLDGIIVHELAHIKRRDHLVSWIELAAGIVWWWNPLFWSVRAALREQAELACDAWVISALPNGRRAYAESLLALSGAAVLNPSMAAVGIRPTSRRVLERRLVMIMKGRTALRLPGAGVCCLAFVAAATLPAWASAPQQPPPLPARPPVATQLPPSPPPTPAPAVKEIQQPPRVVERQTPPVRKMPAPPPPVVIAIQPNAKYAVTVRKNNLPAEGLKLVETMEADQKAIQDEAAQKVDARRAAAVKELEALQEQFTKAGKLDEAVAIRDYLRAGGPGANPFFRYAIKKNN